MSKPRDKEYQFSRLVARVRGAVTEMHPGCAQGSGASLDGGADALSGANFSGTIFSGALFGCADGFDGGMG